MCGHMLTVIKLWLQVRVGTELAKNLGTFVKSLIPSLHMTKVLSWG